MAGKKAAAGGKKKASPKAKATPEPKVKAVDGKSASQPAAAEVGHNSRVPNQKELQDFFGRLDSLHEQKASKNAEFMSDIKGVYDNAASKLGVSRKAMRTFYGRYRAEIKYEDQIAEWDNKDVDDIDRLTAAGSKFGTDSPFGQWCQAQAASKGRSTVEKAEDKTGPVTKAPTKDDPKPDPIAAAAEKAWDNSDPPPRPELVKAEPATSPATSPAAPTPIRAKKDAGAIPPHLDRRPANAEGFAVSMADPDQEPITH